MVQVDKSRSGLLSDVVQAANRRLKTDNLYAFMGDPIRIGFLIPNPDRSVGNDIDLLFQSSNAEECIEFIKRLGKNPGKPSHFSPNFNERDHINGTLPDSDKPTPRSDLYGRLIIAEDWDGNELKRGTLEEVNVPFDFKIDGEWWTIGESYNCDLEASPLKLFGAWKP